MRATGNLGFGHLLYRTAQLLRMGGLQAAALYFLVRIPAELFVFYHDFSDGETVPWMVIIGIVLLFSLSLTVSLTVFNLHVEGRAANMRQTLDQALDHWFVSTKANAAVMLCFYLATVGCVMMQSLEPRWLRELVQPVFGILILSRLGFACVVAVRDPVRVREALHRSWLITEGHGWRSFGMCVVMFTLFVAVGGLLRDAVMRGIFMGSLSMPALYPARIAEGLSALVFHAFMVCFHLELEEAERQRHPCLAEASVGPLIS